MGNRERAKNTVEKTGLLPATGKHCRAVGRGGGSDDHPFLGANFIHFLCKVLVLRSVQKEPF